MATTAKTKKQPDSASDTPTKLTTAPAARKPVRATTQRKSAQKMAEEKPVTANQDGTAQATSPEKKKSLKPPKLVRDSFTFPESDYAKISELKARMLAAGHEVKKSEVLRAGLTVLSKLSDQRLITAIDSLVKIKTGRPKKK